MKKFTKEKGITLIALVITIIVMLILVAVTISVAINGGLFKKANEASKQMQIEADREELQAAVLDTIDNNGKVQLDQVYGKLQDHNKWSHTSGTNKFTATHSNGDINEFTVTINANGGFTVAYVEPSSSGESTIEEETTVAEAPEDLVKYILGADETGRLMTEIAIYDEDDDSYSFLDDEILTPDIDESSNVIFIGYCDYGGNGNDMIWICIKYAVDENYYFFNVLENEYWDIDAEMTTPISTSEKIKVEFIADGNVGKTATIDGEKYIVLYDAGEKGENVQLVSANTYEVDNVYLGRADNIVDWTDSSVIAAANIFEDTQSGQSVLTNAEKAIYSYNNAITTLNAKCRSVVGNTNSDILDVRCIGSNPTNKNSENTTLYTSSLLQGIPSSSGTYSAGAFNGIGKGGDSNFVEDYMRLLCIGAAASENSKAYWLASRDVYENSSDVYFGVGDVDSDGGRSSHVIWHVDSSNAYGSGNNRGVRPVVYLDSEVLADYLDE